MQRRYREPVFLAFVLALVASLSVHLPLYDVLGDLADHWRELAAESERDKLEPVEVDFDFDPSATTEPPKPKTRAQRKAAAKAKAKEQQQQKKVAQAEPQQEQPQQKPPPEKAPNRQAIQQRSQNPDVEPPPDANYVADQNQRVEEETVAKVRSYVRDDPDTSVGAQQKPATSLDQEGNSQDDEVADARDKQGSEARTVTEDEAKKARPDKAIDADPIKAERVASQAPDGRRSSSADEKAGVQSDDTITITDGAGTFTVRRPSNAGQGGGGRAQGSPGTQLTWSKFEAAVGSDQLREDRRARIAEHKSSQAGISREKTWNEFRSAIENFTPTVTPGEQTALNAAASPFAAYIAAIHRRIHRQYADRFLRNIPVFAGSPYSDPTLMTELEIVLNQDGSVHRVGIVRSSGLLPFDFGAFNSVLRAQPYPPAPSAILSGDKRVYLHWGFYRNQRQCGTFNAEPYILPNPPGTPARKGLTDGPDFETVVPADAQPTWRTRGEPDDSDSDSDAPPDEPRRNEGPPAQPRDEDDAPEAPPAPPGSALG